MKNELGISNDGHTLGNGTYELSNSEESDFIEKHIKINKVLGIDKYQ